MPIGSNFDDFLREEGIYETATTSAMKKVLTEALEIHQLDRTNVASASGLFSEPSLPTASVGLLTVDNLKLP